MKKKTYRNLFREKVAWVEKVGEVDRVSLNGFNTLPLEKLPKELILKEPVLPKILLILYVLGIAGFISWKIFVYFKNKPLADYGLLVQTVIVGAVSLVATILYPVIQKIQRNKPKFRFCRRT